MPWKEIFFSFRKRTRSFEIILVWITFNDDIRDFPSIFHTSSSINSSSSSLQSSSFPRIAWLKQPFWCFDGMIRNFWWNIQKWMKYEWTFRDFELELKLECFQKEKRKRGEDAAIEKKTREKQLWTRKMDLKKKRRRRKEKREREPNNSGERERESCLWRKKGRKMGIWRAESGKKTNEWIWCRKHEEEHQMKKRGREETGTNATKEEL